MGIQQLIINTCKCLTALAFLALLGLALYAYLLVALPLTLVLITGVIVAESLERRSNRQSKIATI